MIIDDLRLSDAGASNDRDGFAADHLGPDLHELEQIHVEAEAEPTAPSPTADHNDTGIDSPLGIYFRDIARIPLLTAEQEVDLAQKLERGELAKQRLRECPPETDDEVAARPANGPPTGTSRSGTALAPP